MNERVLLFIFFLIVVVVLVKVAEQLVRRRPALLPFGRIERLFTAAERSFLGVLEQVFGNQYRIFGKVRLGDIVRTRSGLSNSAKTSAFNRICSKHVDFVLCDPRTFEIAGVIELDDSSHELELRRTRDDFVDKALMAAGVPFVRFKAQRGYTPAEVHEKVARMLLEKS